MTRPPALQDLVTLSAAELLTATEGSAAAGRLRDRLIAQPGPLAEPAPERLAVCDWLPLALRSAKSRRAALADAFAAIEGQLVWRRRLTADPRDATFWNGHANAMILGPGGLEERSDIWLGVTLMAPQVTYAPHNHPPEEIYLSLTPGEWWNTGMDWTDPGPTGAIYNPPGILHSMRSGSEPFLALWYLPT
ncbi:MAG: dimethylsulfonioproprionate lyase family protein [Paracoccaceae bacterium]